MEQYNNNFGNFGYPDIYLTSASEKNVIDVSNNKTRYYAELAEQYKNEAKEFRDIAQTYAEQNLDVNMGYINDLETSLVGMINNKLGNEQVTAIINKKVTNCLIEVPQRVQYMLVDGALTLIQGSVVVIPYGTTDQRSTITVGSDFINSGLKVVDTYWDSTNSRFFVWAELKSNLVRAASSGGSVTQRRAFLSISSSSLVISNSANTASASSDAGATQSSVVFYNTTDNLVKSKQSGSIQSNTYSFPIMVTESDATYNIASIKQLFNGIGYIGSVIWTDKGLKGLAPNGRNADESLNNTAFTTNGLHVRDMSDVSNGRKALLLRAQGISRLDDYYCNYDAVTNYNVNRGSGNIVYARVGKFYVSSGVITSAVFDEVVSMNSLCDGDWVNYDLALAQSVTYPTSADITYDLSSYLPKDSNMYQVLLTGSVVTGAAAGDKVDLNIRTDVMYNNVTLAMGQTTANASTMSAGNGMFFVGEGRTVIVKADIDGNGTFNLFVRGYRRVGTNN